MEIANLDYLALARSVFLIEAESIRCLAEKLDYNFALAIDSILQAKGRVIVCGMGKSGIIGRKIAATFASTGTPSFFMHPGEAYHGDLGMVTDADIFLAISNSGETDELLKLLPFLKVNSNFVIAVTGNPASTLARSSGCHLNVHVAQEACPLQLAPTSSTTATLAMGDALAVTLMNARGFKPENFAKFHPGGSLGRRLLAFVDDEMINENLPFISEDSGVLDVIQAITKSSLGLAIVSTGRGLGVITDGDLRRAIAVFGEALFTKKASNFMTTNPITVATGTRIEDALTLMEREKISALLVTDEDQVVGVFKK